MYFADLAPKQYQAAISSRVEDSMRLPEDRKLFDKAGRAARIPLLGQKGKTGGVYCCVVPGKGNHSLGSRFKGRSSGKVLAFELMTSKNRHLPNEGRFYISDAGMTPQGFYIVNKLHEFVAAHLITDDLDQKMTVSCNRLGILTFYFTVRLHREVSIRWIVEHCAGQVGTWTG